MLCDSCHPLILVLSETTDNNMKSNILSASLPLLAAAVFMNSCINEVYDFRKLNPEITVAPGISIPVGMSLGEVSADNLLGFEECVTDRDGVIVQSGDFAQSEVCVSSRELMSGTVQSGQSISVPVSAPDFLRLCKSEFRLHDPEIAFQISNPLPSPVIMRAKAKANEKECDIEFELPSNAVNCDIQIKGQSISELLCPIPDAILIEDISFTAKPETRSPAPDSEGVLIYRLMAQANLRMEFEKGSVLKFDTTLDLEEMGADMSTISVSLNEFDLITSVRSTFPLNLSASAVSENGGTSLSFSNEILACSTTEVKLHAKTDGALGDIRKITVSVTASNTSDGPVALSPSNTLEIDVNRLTAVSGIKYQPRK